MRGVDSQAETKSAFLVVSLNSGQLIYFREKYSSLQFALEKAVLIWRVSSQNYEVVSRDDKAKTWNFNWHIRG